MRRTLTWAAAAALALVWGAVILPFLYLAMMWSTGYVFDADGLARVSFWGVAGFVLLTLPLFAGLGLLLSVLMEVPWRRRWIGVLGAELGGLVGMVVAVLPTWSSVGDTALIAVSVGLVLGAIAGTVVAARASNVATAPSPPPSPTPGGHGELSATPDGQVHQVTRTTRTIRR